MTSAELLRRAAEMVIEFGLEHTGMTAQELRDMTTRGESFLVLWPLPSRRDAIELSVVRRTDGLRTSVKPMVGRLDVTDARRAHLLYGRVIDLAEQIEAMR